MYNVHVDTRRDICQNVTTCENVTPVIFRRRKITISRAPVRHVQMSPTCICEKLVGDLIVVDVDYAAAAISRNSRYITSHGRIHRAGRLVYTDCHQTHGDRVRSRLIIDHGSLFVRIKRGYDFNRIRKRKILYFHPYKRNFISLIWMCHRTENITYFLSIHLKIQGSKQIFENNRFFHFQ